MLPREVTPEPFNHTDGAAYLSQFAYETLMRVLYANFDRLVERLRQVDQEGANH